MACNRKLVTYIEEYRTDKTYQIIDRLSAQFTAVDKDTGQLKFFFWRDEYVEWEEDI